ncbi:MAG: hypothetical protein HY658_15065, partial [Actinobacteria bacterium]|nr:hypothetical protein [Actinomycetota bacterium]
MTGFRIFLLGGFRAEVEGRTIPLEAWKRRRGADLVKVLALAPGHRLHRERVIDALWPDLRQEAGAANLRKAVHLARLALGRGAISVEHGMLSLSPSGPLEVDVDRFQAAADAALEDAGSAELAVDLYPGDLLPQDAYEPWAEEPRRRIRRLYLTVLKAAGRWERVVELDPLDEEAHRMLMRAHLEARDRTAALRQFERLREVLREELGVSPDPETVALHEDVLALEGHEPSTPQELSRAHLAAGLVALNRMDLEEAEREATQARGLAVAGGLGRELGEASGLLGMVAHMRGTWRDLFRREFLEVLEEAPSLAEHVFDAHLCLGEFSLYLPEGHEHAEGFARELLGIAEEHGSGHGRALAVLMLGETELLSGELERAERDLSMA